MKLILILLANYLLFGEFQDSVELDFVHAAKMVEATEHSMSFEWQTNVVSNSFYKLSKYPNQIDGHSPLLPIASNNGLVTRIHIENLDQSSFYYFQSVNILGQDTLYGDISFNSLASGSSGEIEVYFNNSIDETISNGSLPSGTTAEALEEAIIEKMDNAKSSIDYCIYNTNRTSIVNALKRAHDRGVDIRVIFNEREETRNFGFDGTEDYETLERLGNGLMHNKFMVIDGESVNDSWVMSGSTNFTDFQMEEDPNHIIFIQDINLAAAYTIEFEEMWGTNTLIPDLNSSKFGTRKEDNTPHNFVIGGRMVELYFSPSDMVAQRINENLRKAEEEIDASLLIFTKRETRDALLEELSEGTKLRCMIEDTGNSKEVIDDLVAGGAQVIKHDVDGQLHHKYAIVDGSTVITGSHNWTHSADTRHDENVLVIHDEEIANWFQQEYEARWQELTTSVFDVDKSASLLIYPNPSVDLLHISSPYNIDYYMIADINGAKVMEKSLRSGTQNIRLDVSSLNDGTYFVLLSTNKELSLVKQFVKH